MNVHGLHEHSCQRVDQDSFSLSAHTVDRGDKSHEMHASVHVLAGLEDCSAVGFASFWILAVSGLDLLEFWCTLCLSVVVNDCLFPVLRVSPCVAAEAVHCFSWHSSILAQSYSALKDSVVLGDLSFLCHLTWRAWKKQHLIMQSNFPFHGGETPCGLVSGYRYQLLNRLITLDSSVKFETA